MEEREREKDTGSVRTQAENSDKIYICSLFQLKVPRTKCEQIALSSSSRACEHLIYEIGYCYEDRR